MNMEDVKRDLKAVDLFKKWMLRKLGDNTDKEHWLKMSYEYLLDRLKEETRELETLLLDDKVSYKHKKVILECADVANFAMMIADKARLGKIF